MMVDLQRPVALPTEEQTLRLMEQTDYLEGVLWSDPDLRMNKLLDAERAIDPYSTGTKAFWRGVLETAGYIAMSSSGLRAYPRVEMRGSYSFLTKFLAFLQEEIHTRNGVQWAWDADGKLAFQALGQFIRVTGLKAQEVARVLYVGQRVGRESTRHVVDNILGWTGRK